MANIELPKAYDSDKEMDIYKLWEDSGYFNPDNIKSSKSTFSIPLPPPNANGELHIGHMCGYSFQDCMGRFNRMCGHPTLLLPGKDHAGIQTEAVFTKKLKKDGINKRDLGRDDFYKKAYEFTTDNAKYAQTQEKRIGLSADWSREKFTLDPKLTEIIYQTFYKMLEEGLVYRGPYIINQCTKCGTALANVDTDHENKPGIFAYIKYPLVEDETKYITVATTRPETMLGDTAIAVNSDDDRYKNLVGKKVKLPLTDREIPIIADRTIDKDLGTGALKVTPAHSSIDFKLGQQHDLEIINVIDETGRMNQQVPEKYIGLKVAECRTQILEDLDKEGYLERVEDIEHDVIVCERCGTDIEQIISKQWFVKVEPLAQKAIEALDSGKTKVLPENQHKVLRHWFENIEPWCISRQLWWGHRIPVWYCGSKTLHDWLMDNPGKTVEDYKNETGEDALGCGKIIGSESKPNKCPKCGDTHFEQESDVFDTWFSSGQWPYSTLGGPGADDYNKYYPTQVMETARDILMFWVARMMMMGLYRTSQVPFSTVYLHGMILARDGQKMSKSKGNGVEPAQIFETYGADALRLWNYSDTLPGQNTPLRDEKLRGNRNFVNKIWNASRYVMFQLNDLDSNQIQNLDTLISENLKNLKKLEDDWFNQFRTVAKDVTRHIKRYRFNLAVEAIREFFWHTFCDKWIEETKKLIQEHENSKLEYLARLISLLILQLKIMHPFTPFVTEKVWQSLQMYGLLGDESELLMVSEWPVDEE